MDEPYALDPISSEVVEDLITNLGKIYGACCHHNLAQAKRIADEVLFWVIDGLGN